MATFKLGCDMNIIKEEAATWVLPNYVKMTIAIVLNSRICAEDSLSPFPASVHYEETRSRKIVSFYKGIANYMMKKYAADQANVENVGAILRYV